MPQSLEPTPSKLQRLLGLITTPLVGEDYSHEEMYEDPSKIMSPERVLGMTSSPLDIFLGLTGMGALSRFGKAGKVAKSARRATKSVESPSVKLDPRVGGVPNQARQAVRKPIKSMQDVEYEMIMRKLHGRNWTPRPNVDIPKELLEKYRISSPTTPRPKLER